MAHAGQELMSSHPAVLAMHITSVEERKYIQVVRALTLFPANTFTVVNDSVSDH